MRTVAVALFLSISTCALAQETSPLRAADASCGPVGTSYMRTTLYFGLNRRVGNISGSQWKSFVKREVTTRFPQGHTVMEAGGQWRRPDGAIVRERSKVLLLVHEDSEAVRDQIRSIVERYKQMFEQESVLWETARVCAAF